MLRYAIALSLSLAALGCSEEDASRCLPGLAEPVDDAWLVKSDFSAPIEKTLTQGWITTGPAPAYALTVEVTRAEGDALPPGGLPARSSLGDMGVSFPKDILLVQPYATSAPTTYTALGIDRHAGFRCEDLGEHNAYEETAADHTDANGTQVEHHKPYPFFQRPFAVVDWSTEVLLSETFIPESYRAALQTWLGTVVDFVPLTLGEDERDVQMGEGRLAWTTAADVLIDRSADGTACADEPVAPDCQQVRVWLRYELTRIDGTP